MAIKTAIITLEDGRTAEIDVEVSDNRPETFAGKSVSAVRGAMPPMGFDVFKSKPVRALSEAGERVGEVVTEATGIRGIGERYASGEIGGQVRYPVLRAAAGTALSAAEGVPYSLKPEEMAAGVGMGAIPGIGKVTSGLRTPIQEIPAMGQKAAATGARWGVSKATGVSPEALEAMGSRPETIKTASIGEIASGRIPAIAEKFDLVVKELSKKAKGTLSTSKYINEGAVPKTKILEAVKLARKELGGVYTPESTIASNVLKKISTNMVKLTNTVTQNKVADLISNLDREIPWTKVWKSPETLTATDKSLINLRGKLDGVLKSGNTKYAELMRPLSEAIQSRNRFLKQFSVEKIREAGPEGAAVTKYVPSNRTYTALEGAAKTGKVGTERVLEGVRKAIDENLAPEIRDAIYAREFEKSTMRVPFTDIKFQSGGLAGKAARGIGGLERFRAPFLE